MSAPALQVGQRARLTRKYFPPDVGLSPGDTVRVVEIGSWSDESYCITIHHATAGYLFCDPDELEPIDADD